MHAKDLEILCIIPARRGSKRIPRKNLLPLAGLPLLAHSLLHANEAALVRETCVSTDDEEIAALARRYGARVIPRPAALETDQATSESALLHVLDDRRREGHDDPDLVVFLQCTSPVRGAGDIDKAIERLFDTKGDSLFSATKNDHLIWGEHDDRLKSINYDYRQREREQDMPSQYRENGSIYVFRPEILRRFNNRLGGHIVIYEMDYWSSFQLDNKIHVELLEWILRRSGFRPRIDWPDPISLVVFDFDGVMTDNTMWISQSGEESVRANRSDGWGLGQLRAAGVPIIVLSTETNPVVATRCAKLKLECHQGISDKAAYLADYLRKKRIGPAHVVFVGNDTNDLECFRMVGFPVAVADARAEIRGLANLVLQRRGGQGAVREVCDYILERLHDRAFRSVGQRHTG